MKVNHGSDESRDAQRVDGLALDPHNANKGSDRGRQLVVSSLEECGAGRSILADRQGVVIAGNKTLEAARKLGLPVRTIETDGQELVVVRRSDLDLASDEKARRLAYLDNRASELGLDWDVEQLLADLEAGVDLSGIFERPDLDALLATLELSGLADPDEVPPVPAVPTTRPGDLWLCDKQRILCGDATDPEDVKRLLEGGQPRLLVSDPPYGVSLDLSWRDGVYNKLGAAAAPYMTEGHSAATISGDTRVDWSGAFELVPSLEVAYVWHAGAYAVEVGLGLERIGYEIRAQIIWDKTVLVISRGAYHWQHEPCWYAVKKGVSAGWIGTRDQSTVWAFPTPKAIMAGSAEEKLDHPTQKPFECMARPVRNHAGDVYEPFSGSGTTLVACESLHRRCLAMEIDPRFVDLAVLRWQRYAGKEAVLDGDGRTISEIAAARTSQDQAPTHSE
jgi:DNA modification methylase